MNVFGSRLVRELREHKSGGDVVARQRHVPAIGRASRTIARSPEATIARSEFDYCSAAIGAGNEILSAAVCDGWLNEGRFFGGASESLLVECDHGSVPV